MSVERLAVCNIETIRGDWKPLAVGIAVIAAGTDIPF